MKKTISLLFVLFSIAISAQSVIISKMQEIVSNKDKHLYVIEDTQNAQYLGELEIGGFSKEDVQTFDAVYKKAKQLGANAFKLRPIEEVDGTLKAFDPNHYFLSLYYLPSNQQVEEKNVAYLIGSSSKDLTLKINDQKIILPARSFKKLKLEPGTIYDIAAKRFLGSNIKLQASENQKAIYLQVSGFKVKANPYGEAGINLKTGDLMRVENSFGMFLTTIYQEVQ
ncbi:hypothetical protein [Elizabethkingia sp. JS20170427COW]|uniref:hypothetical protein n=1 Tax=Elizabethkingia sp. JS20170427COW TaxID=2583851 RepID=UPI001110A1BD|nr:hypothetical protein [Elizabethkingia sp. JS20170427COW]QCX53311.1 hypothetical protein FGE20_05970 [Elizabethkingia sp. JS20170427COW]